MQDLVNLRDQIDIIDDQIVRLFEERMVVSGQVAAYKRSVGKPVLDKEDQLLSSKLSGRLTKLLTLKTIGKAIIPFSI